jgi:hypothetical protein
MHAEMYAELIAIDGQQQAEMNLSFGSCLFDMVCETLATVEARLRLLLAPL